RDIALLRFRTAPSRFLPRRAGIVTRALVSRGLTFSEDSREIVKALAHGAYRARARLGTRITEDADVSLRCTSPVHCWPAPSPAAAGHEVSGDKRPFTSIERPWANLTLGGHGNACTRYLQGFRPARGWASAGIAGDVSLFLRPR